MDGITDSRGFGRLRQGIARYARQLLRPSHIPAILALVVIVTAASFAELQNRSVYHKSQQTEVLQELGLIRARLEGAISGNIQLVRGFVATLVTEPQMDQQRFDQLAEQLFDNHSQLRSVAIAPDLVVTMTYPLWGNEAAIGLDYNANSDQREAALRARDTGEMVLAGPLNLVQGGQGFVARFPVFVREAGQRRFWGIVAAVIDADLLYQHSGLFDADLDLDIAIVGRDGLGTAGTQFFGDPHVAELEPVTADVTLPTGNWTIMATPSGGWGGTPPNALRLYLWILLAGALVMIPTLLSGRLIDERQRNIKKLKEREIELEKLSRRHGLALETSQVGVWELNIENKDLFWDARMNELYGYEREGTRDYSHWAQRLHPDDRERAEREFAETLRTRTKHHSEYRLLMPDSSVRHIRAIGTIYQYAGGPARIVGVNWDVTEDVRRNEELRKASALTEARNVELEAARKRVEHTAMHDSLTGLPNRRYLDDVLAEHAKNFADGERAALLHVDLDRFKQINDTMGHAAGDAMLVHAANVLRTTVAEDDFVARVGGDEFVIVRRRPETSKDIEVEQLSDLAERIIKAIKSPIRFEGHECRCGGSIGIALDTSSVADPTRLLVNADIALYRAKARGRNRFQFFN